MRLEDGIKLQGQPAIIPESSRDDLPQFFKNMGYKIGVEIGTHMGGFTEKLCQAGLKVYTVDPWIGFAGQGRQQQLDAQQEEYRQEALKRLAPYSENCIIIRETSMGALSLFKDGSLDFVYIDGDHNFKHTAADIFEWSKKVRNGGVVSGHDYWNSKLESRNVICHAKAVVDAYTKLFNITNWFLTGEGESKHWQIKPSWLWIKE